MKLGHQVHYVRSDDGDCSVGWVTVPRREVDGVHLWGISYLPAAHVDSEGNDLLVSSLEVRVDGSAAYRPHFLEGGSFHEPADCPAHR